MMYSLYTILHDNTYISQCYIYSLCIEQNITKLFQYAWYTLNYIVGVLFYSQQLAVSAVYLVTEEIYCCV